jgi:hypothetical protein
VKVKELPHRYAEIRGSAFAHYAPFEIEPNEHLMMKAICITGARECVLNDGGKCSIGRCRAGYAFQPDRKRVALHVVRTVKAPHQRADLGGVIHSV